MRGTPMNLRRLSPALHLDGIANIARGPHAEHW